MEHWSEEQQPSELLLKNSCSEKFQIISRKTFPTEFKFCNSAGCNSACKAGSTCDSPGCLENLTITARHGYFVTDPKLCPN